jgi:hypothetical protein
VDALKAALLTEFTKHVTPACSVLEPKHHAGASLDMGVFGFFIRVFSTAGAVYHPLGQ